MRRPDKMAGISGCRRNARQPRQCVDARSGRRPDSGRFLQFRWQGWKRCCTGVW